MADKSNNPAAGTVPHNVGEVCSLLHHRLDHLLPVDRDAVRPVLGGHVPRRHHRVHVPQHSPGTEYNLSTHQREITYWESN